MEGNRPAEKKNPGELFRQAFRKTPWKKIGLGAVIASLVLILALFLLIWRLIAIAPAIDSINVSPSGSATWICDADGNELRRLSLSESNRDIVSLDEIPDSLINAVIAIEDSRFYEHNGIDFRGIARAFRNGITSGSFSEGASTITQQLIKNNVFTEWTQETSFADRFARKVQEQYLALQLEKQLSKEEILEDYLNTINLGSGCYGVEAASQRYFGKDVSGLTLSESAVLAAIPQNPSGYSPIDYPEANQTRQRLILRYMEEQGYVTHEERMEALEDDVYTRIHAYNESYEADSVYTYYEDALIEQVIELLVSELNYSEEQASQAVYSGGLRIYTAQDAKLQEICDEEFRNLTNFPEGTQYGIDYSLSVQEADGSTTTYGSEALRAYVRDTDDSSFNLLCETQAEAQNYADAFREYVLSGVNTTDQADEAAMTDSESNADTENNANSDTGATEETTTGNDRATLSERLTLTPQPQASLVLIEQETGFVRAIVGGRGEKTASLTLNRATGATRQPGSTFKILTAYAPALDADGQTLATLYENEPFAYEDGTTVSNWDITDYSGTVTIREAITRSINVVAVRCITEITPRLGFSYAEKLGITTLVDDWESQDGTSDVIQPLALGGITNGVTNLELCAAYASIANGGMYGIPLFFTKILDRNGNVLLDASGRSASAEATSISGKAGFSSFTRVLQDSTAFLLTNAMEDVVSSAEGTAYGSVSAAGQPVAGKTGTTSSYKDIWFVGYTPYYTCSVWGGYDNNQSLPDGSSWHSYSRTLWSAVMERIHAELSAASFSIPESITTVTLCSDSHLPAQDGVCPSVYTEYFAKGTEPGEICSIHEVAPETESEISEDLIYPDLLKELFPESEQESESESENESESESESGNKNGSESESESKLGNKSESESENRNEDKNASENESNNEDKDASENESANEAGIGNTGESETNSLDDLINRLTKINPLI